jgi:hypothetical protein
MEAPPRKCRGAFLFLLGVELTGLQLLDEIRLHFGDEAG